MISDANDAGIKQQINYFIQVEESNLGQYQQLHTRSRDATGQLIVAGVSEGVKAIVADLFSSPLAGRFAKGFTKNYFRQDEQRTLATQENNLDAQHRYIVQSALGLLQSVSLKKSRMKGPNSSTLVERLNKAQGFSHLDTRIKRTVRVLKGIIAMPLIFNRDIPPPKIKQPKLAAPKLAIRFPRIASILTEVVGLEPKLRNHIRKGMSSEYGETWIEKIKGRFGSSVPKWEAICVRRGGRDILDGTEFGELLNIINQFEVLRRGVLVSDQAQLALKIVQGERHLLVHPLEGFVEDIDDARYKATSMALNPGMVGPSPCFTQ